MPDKEFFAVLNDPRIMPYRGEKVLLFRESSYWYEVEVVICNTLHHDQWEDFCNKHKVLYWVYLDKVDNLIQRPVKETLTNNWHTPDLPLWEGESYEAMNYGLTKPRGKPLFMDMRVCERCSARVVNEDCTIECLKTHCKIPKFNTIKHRRGFIQYAKDKFDFPNCFTLTKPKEDEHGA